MFLSKKGSSFWKKEFIFHIKLWLETMSRTMREIVYGELGKENKTWMITSRINHFCNVRRMKCYGDFWVLKENCANGLDHG